VTITALLVYVPTPILSIYKLWMRMRIDGFKLRAGATHLSQKMLDNAKKEEYERRRERRTKKDWKIGLAQRKASKSRDSADNGPGTTSESSENGSDKKSEEPAAISLLNWYRGTKKVGSAKGAAGEV
jgi:hypothetical protein